MKIQSHLRSLLVGATLLVAGCGEIESGPISVTAIGAPPQRVNPNLRPLNPATAFVVEALAQGLVRFDATGEIEPALAQTWVVSDDGLRYTFRIGSATWSNGERVTAAQVASRLRAAYSRASRNPYKSVLGAIEDVEAMTDQVLEIRLKGPRPNLLQLLAQPEMAIILENRGTGPFVMAGQQDGAIRLTLPPGEEGEEEAPAIDLLLRGEPANLAIARFVEGGADLLVGGTAGNLPLVRAAGVSDDRLVFDPVTGLFGLAFASSEGPLGDAGVRRALSMAVDRNALVAAIGVPGLQPRLSLLAPVADELAQPALPEWAASPLPMRRELATQTIAALEAPLRLRIAMPEGPGYRVIFAHLRRDWRLIGVEATRVEANAEAELRLTDEVAPGVLASWYLRHFACGASAVCDPAADEAMEAARVAPSLARRRVELSMADQMLTTLTPFIPLAAPVRWSLVAPRLTGFRPNAFARHPAGTLILQE